MDKPIQVVVRALDVLGSISEAPRGRSLQELNAELGIPLASLHRILASLQQTHHVSRSAVSRRYFPGPATRRLRQYNGTIGARLVEPPAPVLVASQQSGETVFLAEMIGDTPICVALAEAVHALRLFVHIGQVMPLHAAASSRAILAYQPQEDVRKLLSETHLTGYTPDTPRTVMAVLEHLSEVRERGYDICQNELDENVWAISAPIISGDGVVRSSVTLAAAGSRMTEESARRRAVEIILSAAENLSLELGGSELPAFPDKERSA